MKKHIDKLCLYGNNIITLIKHFIKHKIKQNKDIIVKNGKKTVTTVSFPFFCILIVKNIQKIYFEIMKYIKI